MLKIIHKHVLSSTQDYAWELLSSYKKDMLVIADTQTAGRGSCRERLWVSAKGNFHGSFVINISKLGYDHSNIASLNFNVMQAIQQTLIGITKCCNINLKLPNDLYYKNKKMAGVLIEISYPLAIIGIGINLISAPIETSTSIKDSFGIKISNTDRNFINALYNKIVFRKNS